MNNEIKEILEYFNKYINDEFSKYTIVNKDTKYLKILLDYITNLQEDYDRAMELVDKGVENSYIKIKEQQKEIEKLTAESTEWESKCYDLQEENERLKNEPLTNKMSRIDSVVANIYRNNRKQEDYKSRNEKAIEYGKELRLFDNESLEFEIGTKFINILQGEDK